MIKEGTYEAKVVDCRVGENSMGERCVEVMFDLGGTNGKMKKQFLLNERAIYYTKRDLQSLGWDGKKAAEISAQVVAAAAVTEVEVKHVPTKKGTLFPVIGRIGSVKLEIREYKGSELADIDAAFASVSEPQRNADSDGHKRFNDIPF